MVWKPLSHCCPFLLCWGQFLQASQGMPGTAHVQQRLLPMSRTETPPIAGHSPVLGKSSPCAHLDSCSHHHLSCGTGLRDPGEQSRPQAGVHTRQVKPFSASVKTKNSRDRGTGDRKRSTFSSESGWKGTGSAGNGKGLLRVRA